MFQNIYILVRAASDAVSVAAEPAVSVDSGKLRERRFCLVLFTGVTEELLMLVGNKIIIAFMFDEELPGRNKHGESKVNVMK